MAVDAAEMGVEALGSLLEASDLTPSPAPALGRVLAGGAEPEPAGPAPRDVLLLTHPRSLVAPDVAASARALAVGTRLFAVAVDAGGEVVLSELRHGAPVAIGRCRVEVGAGPAPGAVNPPAGAGEPRPWRGDVEPIFWKTADQAERVLVAGTEALWLPTVHRVTVVPDGGSVRDLPSRLAGPTLLWLDGDLTLRLEGDLDLAEATQIAESVD